MEILHTGIDTSSENWSDKVLKKKGYLKNLYKSSILKSQKLQTNHHKESPTFPNAKAKPQIIRIEPYNHKMNSNDGNGRNRNKNNEGC